MKSLTGLAGALLLLLLPIMAAAVEEEIETGEWEPININDLHIQELAVFAVTEYDKQSQRDLKFETVLGGYQQVVAGMNYKLVIAAKDRDGSGRYEAVVWEKEYENFRKLVSFKRILEG